MPEPQLRIELLGHVRVVEEGAPEAVLASGRRRALLAYLALHRHESVDRERLAYLFWPESEDGQARTNLRRELHHLRSELPHADAVLDIGAATVRWRQDGPAVTDVAEFEEALTRAARARERGDRRGELGHLARAAERYRGDLLPSCYEDWVEPERRRLRLALLAALARLTELLEVEGDHAAALANAERIVRLDPLDESAYRSLMRLHQRDGNRAAAIHAYHRCAGALQRELGIGPGRATRAAYQALLAAEGGPSAGSEARETRESAPLVGRERALETLTREWGRARAGLSLAVVVQGEAGIGKTRLVTEFARTCLQQGASVVRSRAYAAEGRPSYGLAVDWLRAPAVADQLPELPLAWRAEIGRLAPDLEPDGGAASEPPDTVPASWQRRRLLEAIARGVLAAPAPRLLVVDDLQWADADSLDALHLLVRLEQDAPLLVLGTARSEELPGNPALQRLLLALRGEGRLRDLELGRLAPHETARLARQVAASPLSDTLVEELQSVSDGVPLFVVEALRARRVRDAHDPRPQAEAETLPPRVRAVLTARLDQLNSDARELAELAATIGRAFDFQTLRQASDLPEEELVRALDELWRRRIVLEHAADTYDFSHDALRDAAYAAIDPARRRLLHRRVARALERLTGDTVAVTGRLAQHYEQGGEIARAVDAYRRAAAGAAALFSHQEALRLLDRASALLERFPPSEERDQRDLALELARIVPARSLGGYTAPALAAAAARGAELAERLHDLAALYHALRSLQTTQFVGGRLTEAFALSDRLDAIADELPLRRAEGEHVLAGTLLTAGELDASLAHFERAEREYDPGAGTAQLSVFGSDLAVFTSAWQAHALWLAGYADRAVAASQHAVRRAQALTHPYSRALAHAYAAMLHHMRRDRRACLEHAAVARRICERHGFAYYVHWGRILHAWADRAEPASTRAARIRDGIAGLDNEGALVRRPYYLSVLAQTLARAGRLDEAVAALTEAEARAEATGERWWLPEIARLHGVLAPQPGMRIAFLGHAVQLAGELHARPLAARAAVGLAASLRAGGRRDEAAAVLASAVRAAAAHEGDRDRRRAERLLAQLSR